MIISIERKDILIFFDSIKKNIVERAKQKDQDLTGKIPKSIQYKFRETNDYVEAQMYSTFKWIKNAWEYGRGKTKNNGNGALRKNLEKWIVRKGLSTFDDVKSEKSKKTENKKESVKNETKDIKTESKKKREKSTLTDDEKKIKSLAYVISRKIHEEGTALNRSKDKRFSGRQSGTISDFINEQNLNEFIKAIGKNVTFEITKLIRDD